MENTEPRANTELGAVTLIGLTTGTLEIARLIGEASIDTPLASCSSTRVPEPVTPTAPTQQSGGISGPADFNRPHKDGAPWWDERGDGYYNLQLRGFLKGGLSLDR